MAKAFLDSLMASEGWSVETPFNFGTYKRYEHERFTRCWYLKGSMRSKENWRKGPFTKDVRREGDFEEGGGVKPLANIRFKIFGAHT